MEMSWLDAIYGLYGNLNSIISLVVMVFAIVANWLLFERAGEHGWGAIIPFYNYYISFKIAGRRNLFWGWLAAYIVSVLSAIVLIVTAVLIFFNVYAGPEDWGDSFSPDIVAFLASCLFLLLSLVATFILRIFQCIGFAQAYGQGAGFAIGLLFLNVIFLCILAFGKKYPYVGTQQGPQVVPTPPNI